MFGWRLLGKNLNPPPTGLSKPDFTPCSLIWYMIPQTSCLRHAEQHHWQWENMCIDTEIDDSRCRKVLGYRNRYTLPQTVKWIVDTVAAEEEDRGSLYAVDDPRWSGKA